MFRTWFRTYWKFLSRHKVYSFVSVVGFAISLTFVIVLSVYAKAETSFDSFHEKGDRLFILGDEESFGNANPIAEYVKGLLPEVESYARVMSRRENVGRTEREWFGGNVLYADREFFNMFSFPLIEGDPGNVLAVEKSAVLGKTAALKMFGDEDPVGRSVVIGRNELTVTGVMEDFPYNTHIEAADVVVPYELTVTLYGPEILDIWWASNFNIYFLGRENTDLRDKEEYLLEKFREDYWPYEDGYSDVVQFVPVRDIYFSGMHSPYLKIKSGSRELTGVYFGVAILILVIALLNYVNMTVAQTGFRGREAAVKRLMGSTKGRLLAQLLTESLLMTTLALILALVCVFAGEPLFERLLDTRLDLAAHLTNRNAVALIFGSLIAVSLVAGILPALAVASFRPIEVVKGTITRRVKSSYSKVLIVFQFTICSILLICTFLMARQAEYMRSKDLGFNYENILVLDNVTGLRGEALIPLRDRIMQVPGVEAVAYASGTPFDGGNNNSFDVDGRPVSFQIISGDSAYVGMLGLKFLEEFPVTAGDISTLVYMNRAGIHAVQPDSTTWQFDDWRDDAFIGGVLDNFHISSLHNSIGPTMFFYQPDDRSPWELLVKISSPDLYGTASAVRDAYLDFNGGKHFDWYFADDRVQGWYDNERRMTTVMGAFTLLSMVIMLMGVFAMSLYMIRQREKEIGVRKVSGATVGEVLAMLNRQSLSRVAVAFVIACPVAYYAISRWLQTFAYKVNITPVAFITAGLIVTALCLLSVSWQTWKAARANPVKSLKSE